MGNARRKLQIVAVIDTDVTVSGGFSQIWDMWAIVGSMVAPYLATPTTEVLNPFGGFATATIHVVDYPTADASRSATMARLSTPDTTELTAELDGATAWLGVPSDEILLAALARTIARTLGEGVVPVDIASERRCLLDGVALVCAAPQQASATEVLGGVHHAVAAASESAAPGPSEVYFNYIGAVPEKTGAGAGHTARPWPRVGAPDISRRIPAARRLVVRHQPVRSLHGRRADRAVPARALRNDFRRRRSAVEVSGHPPAGSRLSASPESVRWHRPGGARGPTGPRTSRGRAWFLTHGTPHCVSPRRCRPVSSDDLDDSVCVIAHGLNATPGLRCR